MFSLLVCSNLSTSSSNNPDFIEFTRGMMRGDLVLVDLFTFVIHSQTDSLHLSFSEDGTESSKSLQKNYFKKFVLFVFQPGTKISVCWHLSHAFLSISLYPGTNNSDLNDFWVEFVEYFFFIYEKHFFLSIFVKLENIFFFDFFFYICRKFKKLKKKIENGLFAIIPTSTQLSFLRAIVLFRK